MDSIDTRIRAKTIWMDVLHEQFQYVSDKLLINLTSILHHTCFLGKQSQIQVRRERLSIHILKLQGNVG